MKDVLLSLDLDEGSFLYRIRRDRRVLYILVEETSILCRYDRSYGPAIIKKLSSIYHEWHNNDWTTLTIHGETDGIYQTSTDEFKPHSLKDSDLMNNYKRFDVVDLEIICKHKPQVCVVLNPQLDGGRGILKTANFPHELDYIKREILAYRWLEGSILAPKVLGYASEGERIIGLLIEEIDGRTPELKDLRACQTALTKLHALGILHGDVNKYNILISKEGPMFVDFESAIMTTEEAKMGKMKELQTIEFASLRDKLLDDTGEGSPLSQ